MPSWWKRFRPNQSTLPAAFLATVFCCACLLAIWTPTETADADMTRYGEALSETLAHSNAGLLLHGQRIELAVIANHVSRYREVAGVVFYSTSNEIIALNGSADAGPHFTAAATLDDTITGYVSVVLAPAAFTPPLRLWSWLLTLLVFAVTPFLSLGILQLSARGNRSLPIVSVPEPGDAVRQSSFCLTLNLHNQLALTREHRINAVEDAMSMAREVCAIHQGIAVEIPERGVVMLLDQQSVSGGQAVCAAFLMLRLLADFETDGRFRSYLNQTECAGSPADMAHLSYDTFAADNDIDGLMTLAALARADAVLLSDAVYSALTDHEKTWAGVFSHPLLDDVSDTALTYLVEALPPQQQQLIDSQAELILGFQTERA